MKPRLSTFAKNLLEQWRQLELPLSNASIVIAVSGGADSTALLLGVHELITTGKLNVTPIVAHLDHGLRRDSKNDAKWVADLAKELNFKSEIERTSLKQSKTKPENLEQAARKARYAFLLKTAKTHKAEFVLTAHTADDQAETVLLRLLRGSAAEGLSGTPVIRPIKQGSKVKLVRPLLAWARRTDTEDYCRERQIDFRVDSMNADEAFARVRVRTQLLPLMQSFNNRVVDAINRTARLLGEDASALADEALRLLETAVNNSETETPNLSVSVLLQKPPAVRRRALREWIARARGNLNRLEKVHLTAVEELLNDQKGGKTVELPGGMTVRRTRGMLELSGKKRLKKTTAPSKIRRGRHRQA
jgi:tRNA(Ile)-lysidine synthase